MSLAARLRTPAVLAAVIVAVLTLGATLAYAAQRQRSVYSTTQLVLVPTARDPNQRISQLQTFTSSGVQGTYVEYLASQRVPGGTLEVRGVPDSRVIDVKVTRASGARDVLQGVIATALSQQARLADDWSARELGAPSAEAAAGPTTTVLLAAGVLLALLAGLATFAGVRALTGASREPAAGAAPAREDEDGAATEPAGLEDAWRQPPGASRSYAPLR